MVSDAPLLNRKSNSRKHQAFELQNTKYDRLVVLIKLGFPSFRKFCKISHIDSGYFSRVLRGEKALTEPFMLRICAALQKDSRVVFGSDLQ